MHEGTQDLPKEALLQITADSQSCGDTGSGSLGCDWIQQTFIECLQVEPTLIRCLLAWPLIAYECLLLTNTIFSSPLSNSKNGGIILFHMKGNGSRLLWGPWKLCHNGSYTHYYESYFLPKLLFGGQETSPQQGYGCPARTHLQK